MLFNKLLILLFVCFLLDKFYDLVISNAGAKLLLQYLSELESHPDHNKGPDPSTFTHVLRPTPFIDPNHTTYQTTNPLLGNELSQGIPPYSYY